jgi:Protein of unknown function (DUF1203)
MNFKIKSLNEKEFQSFFNLTDKELEKIGAVRMTADAFPGFPCRVSLEDATIGEEVILLPFKHHNTNSPYQAIGPIFVRKIATTSNVEINEIPIMFHHRFLSLRGYNEDGIMKESSVTEGKTLREEIIKTFENEAIKYIHIHNAKPGCFNCSVERV